jgi:hypothetical protein
MAYDEALAQRVREQLDASNDVEEKEMFSGLCFMVANHMCCGIVGDTLMARVGADNYEELLQQKHAREMDFTGRSHKGMVYVSPQGVETDSDLAGWLQSCCQFVDSLPPR